MRMERRSRLKVACFVCVASLALLFFLWFALALKWSVAGVKTTCVLIKRSSIFTCNLSKLVVKMLFVCAGWLVVGNKGCLLDRVLLQKSQCTM